MSNINIGSNYTLTENSNGNLEVIDAEGTPLLRHDNSADKLIALDPIEVADLIDGADISHTGELADASDITDDHGNLSGLGDDDHPQYLLVDGTRPMSGSLSMSANGVGDLGAVSENETITSPGGTFDADLGNGAVQKITLSQDCDITLTLDNDLSPGATSLTLLVKQDGTGGHGLTFSTTINWEGDGTKPSIGTAAEAMTRIVFTFVDGEWLGSKAGEWDS